MPLGKNAEKLGEERGRSGMNVTRTNLSTSLFIAVLHTIGKMW